MPRLVTNVCGGFFLSTLDIGKKTVDSALTKLNKSGFSLPDMTGRDAKRQIPQEKVNEVKANIMSIPCMESHYCRSSSKRQYLSVDLSVKKIYEAYKDLFVCGISFTSGQLFNELFPDYTRSCFFASCFTLQGR